MIEPLRGPVHHVTVIVSPTLALIFCAALPSATATSSLPAEPIRATSDPGGRCAYVSAMPCVVWPAHVTAVEERS